MYCDRPGGRRATDHEWADCELRAVRAADLWTCWLRAATAGGRAAAGSNGRTVEGVWRGFRGFRGFTERI